jgi:hypothetical protein
VEKAYSSSVVCPKGNVNFTEISSLYNIVPVAGVVREPPTVYEKEVVLATVIVAVPL